MKVPVILRVFKGSQLVEVKQFELEQIVIGQEPDLQVSLDHESISPIHCLIELRDGIYYLCDLGSRTGTQKNGISVLDEPLSSGDEIVIGPYKISFFVGVPKPRHSPGLEQPPRDHRAGSKPILESMKSTMQSSNQASKPVIPQDAPRSLKNSEVEVKSKSFARSQIKGTNKRLKGQTYAPANLIEDLQSFLKPSKGNVLEILVSWKGRILDSFHYREPKLITFGDLNLPPQTVPGGQVFVDSRQGVRVFTQSEWLSEIITSGQKFSIEEALSKSKATKTAQGYSLKLEQNEVIYVTLAGGLIVLALRFIPMTPVVPLLPPLQMTSSELTGLVLTLVLTGILAFVISSIAPVKNPEPEEELMRIAQVVINPPVKVEPKPEVRPPAPPPPPPLEVKPPKPIENKAVQSKEKKENQKKGSNTQQSTTRTQIAKKANDLLPNQSNKPKKFTSTPPGSAVKLAPNSGAGAQSAQKPKTTGIFSALSNSGIRNKLDEAYTGSGGILGMSDKVTGGVGMEQNRPGDDLGEKFKETGVGGKGVATQGIAGVKTKGRASGTSEYGTADGFGEKTRVNIVAGDSEANFIGTIDREAVRRAVQHNKPQVQGCYQRELNKLDLAGRMKFVGRVEMTWDIGEKGIAKNVKVKSSTLNNKLVENCIRERLASWSFPEPPTGMTAEITYPFYFRTGN